jgi:hypothetical protein
VFIDDAIDGLEDAMDHAKERATSSDPAERARARSQVDRIRQLLQLAKLGRRLLDALVERGQVDASALSRVLLGPSRG